MASAIRPSPYLLCLVVVITLYCLQMASSSPLCPNVQRRQQDLSKCRYDTVLNWCGISECAKGPGEQCGGIWREYGTCGEGMYCRCGFCAGCFGVHCGPRVNCTP